MKTFVLIGLIVAALMVNYALADERSLTDVYYAAVSNSERSADERSMDESRKPLEILPFIGLGSGMMVLDMGAGGGYTTMLAARVVGKGGQMNWCKPI